MADTICGRCGRLAHLAAVSGLHSAPQAGGEGGYREAAYKCPNCHRLSIVTQWDSTVNAPGAHGSDAAQKARWPDGQWLPRYQEVSEFPDVPEHIAQAASEATLCLSVGAYRAVGSLARAVIEATAKEKNAEGGNLAQRIDALREGDHIRKHTQEQAHEIRYFGNDMAHGDFVEPVNKEEAEEVVALMSEVLDEVYQSPARLQKRKAARLAKGDQ